MATLRAWDQREAAELICVVGSNTAASGTFKPTFKPASRPSTSTRLARSATWRRGLGGGGAAARRRRRRARAEQRRGWGGE
jgi:hypothetical protein